MSDSSSTLDFILSLNHRRDMEYHRRRLRRQDPPRAAVDAMSSAELDALLADVERSPALQRLAAMADQEAEAELFAAFVGLPGLRTLFSRLIERLRDRQAIAAA